MVKETKPVFFLKCPYYGLCWFYHSVASEIFSCPLEHMVASGSLARLKTSLPPHWWHGLPLDGMSSGIFMLSAKYLRLKIPESRQTHILSKSYNVTVFSNNVRIRQHLLYLCLSKGVSYFIFVGSLTNKAATYLICYISVTSLYSKILFACSALSETQSNTVITIGDQHCDNHWRSHSASSKV